MTKLKQSVIKRVIIVFIIVIALVISPILITYALAGFGLLYAFIENGGTISYTYETQSVEDYGSFPGLAEEYMTEYINRFFPEQILDDYQDVKYVFRRSNIDEYSFEAYLEFTFDSADAFNAHVLDATEGMLPGTFAFDEDFQEYVVYDTDDGFVYDHLMLEHEHYDDGEVSYSIRYAKIAKLLVNADEQRVIYIALALHDGGGTSTSFLRSYFDRFDIDPKEYELYTESVGRMSIDTPGDS